MTAKKYDDDLSKGMMKCDGGTVPYPIRIPFSASLREYFIERAHQHIYDSYCNIPMLKFPEDLRIYEHLLWLSKADTVIELGCFRGGSTLWFRDRLRALAQYVPHRKTRVIGVDLDIAPAQVNLAALDPNYQADIFLLAGDLADPKLAEAVKSLVPVDASCLVIEDAAHTGRITEAALVHYSELVKPAGFFVVEDGFIDGELRSCFPFAERNIGGMLASMEAWLDSDQGASFVIRRDLELYGLTSNPLGILQRNPMMRKTSGKIHEPALRAGGRNPGA